MLRRFDRSGLASVQTVSRFHGLPEARDQALSVYCDTAGERRTHRIWTKNLLLPRKVRLARLVVNQRSGLASEKKHDVITAAVEPAIRCQGAFKYAQENSPAVFVELLGDDSYWNDEVLKIAGKQLENAGVQALLLAGTRLSNIAAFVNYPPLDSLDLRETKISDLEPLTKFTSLRLLVLWKTQVSDLGPLAGLTALQELDLMETQVSDLAPLADLTKLQLLDLMKTEVSDLRPLAGLTALRSLFLMETQVSDLGPLGNLTALRSLDVRATQASEGVVSELRDALPKCKVLF